MTTATPRRRLSLPVLLALVTLALALSCLPLVGLAEQGYSNTSPRAYWVPPGRCNTSTSGVGAVTGTSGMQVTGASSTPTVQITGSDSGSFTVTFVCTITPPDGIITSGNGLAIVDAVFAHGNVNYLGTQSATLASGTMNGATVFSTITYPAAGASETASTVTPVRADSGTLLITPVVASANATTGTAGAFYTIRFTPATPIAWKTDLTQLLLTVRLTAQTGLETTINSPGVLVHYRSQ